MDYEKIEKFEYEDKGASQKIYKVNGKEINCKGITKMILTFEGGCKPRIEYTFSSSNADLIPRKEIGE